MNVRPRSELVPTFDAADGLPEGALLEESERRKLQSYRPPSGVEGSADAVPTVRWSDEELAALLAIARATVEPDGEPDEPDEGADDRSHAPTLPPPCKRPTIRRSKGG